VDGTDADHEVALREPAAHGPVHHEAKAAEHLLLDDVISLGEKCTDPRGELLVVAHERLLPRMRAMRSRIWRASCAFREAAAACWSASMAASSRPSSSSRVPRTR